MSRQEVTREVDQLLRLIFKDHRKTGRLDWEAIEAVVRSTMYRAGEATDRTAALHNSACRPAHHCLFLRPTR